MIDHFYLMYVMHVSETKRINPDELKIAFTVKKLIFYTNLKYQTGVDND